MPRSPSLQKSSSLAVAPTIENPCSSSSLNLVTLKQQDNSDSFVTGSSASAEGNSQGQSHSTGQGSSAENAEQTITQHSGTKPSEPAFTPDLCVICLTQPRNASIVHGRTGHQVCCIGCAEKLKEGKKKCPVCRKKIKLVVKNFFQLMFISFKAFYLAARILTCLCCACVEILYRAPFALTPGHNW